jgi:hypothetical protein
MRPLYSQESFDRMGKEDSMHREIENLRARISTLEFDVQEPLLKYQRARYFSEWHEDYGPVLWWTWPVTEPPYAGTPNDSDWPVFWRGSIVWTPMIVPEALA